MNLKGRHFLTLKDYTPEEIAYLLELSADLKKKKKEGVLVDTLRGKNVALIFEKTSTRTRCSFEVAAHDLGMGTTYLDPKGSQIGKKESIADTAKVLGSMYEGIEYRGRTGKIRRCSGMERSDKRISSDTDAGRYADHPGKLRKTQRHQTGLYG